MVKVHKFDEGTEEFPTATAWEVQDNGVLAVLLEPSKPIVAFSRGAWEWVEVVEVVNA